MSAIRTITPQNARRLIIRKQQLDASKTPDMLNLIRELGCVQLDPIRKVERTHLLVLWSRLGVFDVDTLEKLRWEDKSVFEYWAHAASLVLSEDYPIHATYMHKTREKGGFDKLLSEQNLHDLHQHMLDRIRAEGALNTSDFDDDTNTGITYNGWTSGRAVNRLMQHMWTLGEVLPAYRKGNQRYWDLAERVIPDGVSTDALDTHTASYQATQRAVKALGVAMDKKHIKYHFTRNRYWHYKAVKEQLLNDEKLLPVAIDGWDGEWYMHSDDVPLLEKIEAGDWQGHTVLLSPFDNLICDRDRTELIWDFYFRIEIYVPPAKREYGYYVLPILHGDQLIGRISMEMNRKTNTLHALATYAQDDAPADAVSDIRDSLEALADFLGAENIVFGETMPAMWKALRD